MSEKKTAILIAVGLGSILGIGIIADGCIHSAAFAVIEAASMLFLGVYFIASIAIMAYLWTTFSDKVSSFINKIFKYKPVSDTIVLGIYSIIVFILYKIFAFVATWLDELSELHK